ncbi:MAG: magnesium transporter [Gemmataceae bacterium]
MVNQLLLPELRELLTDKNDAALSEFMTEFHPAVIAEFTEGLSVDETWCLLDYAPIPLQADVFAFYPPRKQEQLVQGVGRERMSRLLEAMSHDDRVDLLQRLDRSIVEELLPLVARADREDIRKLLSYPENSAGAVMTTDFASVPENVTVAEALTLLRQQAPSTETIYYVYVLDTERRLLGVVSLRDLIVSRPDTLIRDIMHEEVIAVRVDQDQEEVALTLGRYDFLALPVTDEDNRLVGIVTFDDLADVVQNEATEDFHRTAAIAPLARGYGDTNIWSLYQRRVGWLVALVFVNLASSSVIAVYEETLQAAIALAFFLPLLIDSGGNTGSQAATLIVRALAIREIKLTQWLRTTYRELLVGASLGLTMALASFLLGYMRAGVEVGLIVGISMFSIVLLTNLIGVLLPFVLTRLHVDPAVASSPLITTVSDVTGLLIYFSIATWVMGYMGRL